MNVLFNDLVYTKMTLASLGGKLRVCRNMSSEYSKEFGKTGHKINDVLQVRKPQRFTVTQGMQYQGQPLTNTQTPVIVDQLSGVHFEWDSIERTLQLDYIEKNYAGPAATALANDINSKCAKFIALNTFNQVGTPGTVPTSPLTYLGAGTKLIEQGMPENFEDSLALIVNRKMSDAYIDASKTFFNSQSVIGSQQKTGNVVDQLGYSWYRDQTIYTHTTGAFLGTILVNGAGQTQDGGNNGTGTLITDGHTSGQSTIKAGDIFRITGVNAVHPITRQSTGSLQDFVALTTQTDTSGAMTIVMSPALTASGQYQNIDSLPADNAPILMSGAASAVSTQGLLLHENAFAFLSVPLTDPDPGTGVKCTTVTDEQTGITISYMKYFSGDSRVQRNRFDVLWGAAPLYREMACRVAS
jgi:hypothetical protein